MLCFAQTSPTRLFLCCTHICVKDHVGCISRCIGLQNQFCGWKDFFSYGKGGWKSIWFFWLSVDIFSTCAEYLQVSFRQIPQKYRDPKVWELGGFSPLFYINFQQWLNNCLHLFCKELDTTTIDLVIHWSVCWIFAYWKVLHFSQQTPLRAGCHFCICVKNDKEN